MSVKHILGFIGFVCKRECKLSNSLILTVCCNDNILTLLSYIEYILHINFTRLFLLSVAAARKFTLYMWLTLLFLLESTALEKLACVCAQENVNEGILLTSFFL